MHYWIFSNIGANIISVKHMCRSVKIKLCAFYFAKTYLKQTISVYWMPDSLSGQSTLFEAWKYLPLEIGIPRKWKKLTNSIGFPEKVILQNFFLWVLFAKCMHLVLFALTLRSHSTIRVWVIFRTCQ